MSRKDVEAEAIATAMERDGVSEIVTAAVRHRTAERKVEFTEALRKVLRPKGIDVLGAYIAQGSTGPSWVLTFELPSKSITTVHAAISAGRSLFDSETCDDIATRAERHFRSRGLLAA